ncbi:MAG: pre-peptidase C-terminal domain-containing protein [Actinomycetota bacterium]
MTEREMARNLRLLRPDSPSSSSGTPLVVGSGPGTQERLTNSRLALPWNRKWSNGRTLHVSFLLNDRSAGNRILQQRIEEHASVWTEHANIELEFGDRPDAEIRIAFEGRSSWSLVGTDAKAAAADEPTMNFGWLQPDTEEAELRAVVLHEFGHAFGAVHEHVNPQVRIKWDKPTVYQAYAEPPNSWTTDQVDVNLFERSVAHLTQFSQFDPQSIMLYPIPPEHTLDNFSVGWNTDLSATDRDWMAIAYPDVYKSEHELVIDGPPIAETIGKHGEQDLFTLDVETAGTYVIETTGSTDVNLAIVDGEDDLIVFDDDSGTGYNAKITTDLKPGRYTAKVRHEYATGRGDYQIGARTDGQPT